METPATTMTAVKRNVRARDEAWSECGLQRTYPSPECVSPGEGLFWKSPGKRAIVLSDRTAKRVGSSSREKMVAFRQGIRCGGRLASSWKFRLQGGGFALP